MTDTLFPAFPIIIVDDEIDIAVSESLALEMAGFTNVITCGSASEALKVFEQHPRGLALLDITMPQMSGIELLQLINERYNGVTAIMITGNNDVATAVQCMRQGALDYIVKPINTSRLEATVRSALHTIEMQTEAALLGDAVLKGELRNPKAFASIITADPALFAVFQYIDALSSTDLPILICGETGTGKELIAGAVHAASGRKGQFVCVNSAGISEHLFADTLFGHVKGAFTGAEKDRAGLLERAVNGTIFLDEIGDLRPESQIGLLRLLQEGTYYPLGSDKEHRSTARIVAATNVSLPDLASNKSFRKDLFYRLKAHTVTLPPLRNRKSDLPLLIEQFIGEAAAIQNKKIPAIPAQLFDILATYHFPGNVRELRGILMDAVGRHTGGVLSCESIRTAIGLGEKPQQKDESELLTLSFPEKLPTLAQVEKALLSEALLRAKGNKSLAAAMAGVTRQTLRCKLENQDTDA